MPTEVNNTIIEHIFLRTNHTHQKKPQSYNFGNLFMQSKRKLCNPQLPSKISPENSNTVDKNITKAHTNIYQL